MNCLLPDNKYSMYFSLHILRHTRNLYPDCRERKQICGDINKCFTAAEASSDRKSPVVALPVFPNSMANLTHAEDPQHVKMSGEVSAATAQDQPADVSSVSGQRRRRGAVLHPVVRSRLRAAVSAVLVSGHQHAPETHRPAARVPEQEKDRYSRGAGSRAAQVLRESKGSTLGV
ncbi:hypothetical protein E3U43_010543 [Larimichthys crocea]|uniref:Uncharacterized protein n=1 Tax=Larimichthys crocea TaxID=215358 RepID=A0ACD3RF47_LARCR|nr:hypothetical protein E3U43_010543 [Larimichthys crocea]